MFKPKKGSLLRDSLESVHELGRSTAKKTVKSIVEIVNPLQVLEKNTDNSEAAIQEKVAREGQKHPNSTKLDMEKLRKSFGKSDEQKANELRQKLFDMVKDGEKIAVHEDKEKEKYNTQQEERDKQERAQQEEERRRHDQSSGVPQGKVRKSILGTPHKKASMEQHTEFKPSSSKN